MGEKKCSRCQVVLPLSSFTLNRSMKDGHMSYCRECSRIMYKEWYHKNSKECVRKSKERFNRKRESNLERKRKWYHANKEKISEANKLRYKNNREKLLERSYQWRKNNPRKAVEIRKRYHYANRDKRIEGHRLWIKNNPEKAKLSAKQSQTKRLSTPQGKLNNNICCTIRISLKGNKKGKHWETLVGYTVEALKQHLEKQFKEGMSWENYGYRGWHIDHKIPISVFNFEKPEDEDFKRCWSLKNLQPMWAKDNQSKNAKIDKHFQPNFIFS